MIYPGKKMTTIKPTQEIEVIAFNMRQEKETFSIRILESNPEHMIVKKGPFVLIYDKKSGSLKRKSTGLKCYTNVRFFVRK